MNQDTIQLIRSKLDIVDVISSYIPLTKQGRNYFGVCPFHDDTHPSMSVSREKQIYRCFSCGASGNVITFVQNYEQISFYEALKMLAEQTGVELKGGNTFSKKKNKYDSFYQIYDLSMRIYQNNIQATVGSRAREYLKSRGIEEDVIRTFEIGLASGTKNQLTKLLSKKGFPVSDLNRLGLSIGEQDIYQERILFPLWDTSGKCVAFSGRRYLSEDGSKYINTKETEIFVKGNILYNYHRAREFVRFTKQVIVMEGFMDVIRAYTAGVKNVVAVMGTAMTHEQVSLLRRLSTNIILMFDGDDPGRHATLVNGEQLYKAGFTLKVVELTDGDDPDTYILKYGAESFQNLIQNAITYQDFRIKNLKSGKNLNSDEEKARYVHEVIEETSRIEDSIRREIILKNLAIEFDLSYNTLEKRLAEILKNQKNEAKSIALPLQKKPKDKYYIAPRAVLYYMIQKKEVLEYYQKTGIFFPEEKFRTFASEIIYAAKTYGDLILADFYTYLSDKEELLQIFYEIMELDFIDLEDVSFDIILDYIQVMEKDYKNREIKRLKEKIKSSPDLNEKIRLSEKVRSLKIGS